VTELQVWYGFFDFKFDRLAAIRLRDLMESQDVRDRRKVQAIVHNAREFQRITEKDGSFSNFLESLKALDDEGGRNLDEEVQASWRARR
jgi:3-methyladenine DNA glycosylase Tag